MPRRGQMPRGVRDALEAIGNDAERNDGEAGELRVRRHATRILELAVKATGTPDAVLEDERTAAGGKRPDWRVVDRKTGVLHFYGDHKGLRTGDGSLDWGSHSKQASDYLELSPGGRLLMTDAVDFVVLEKRGPRSSLREVCRARLLDRPLGKGWWKKAMPDGWERVVGLIGSLVKKEREREWGDDELGRVLGLRAGQLTEQVLDVLQGNVASLPKGLRDGLTRAREALRDWYDPSMVDDTNAAEFIAQILVLGSLHAWGRAHSGTPSKKRAAIDGFWEESTKFASSPSLAPFGVARRAIREGEGWLSLFEDTVSLLVAARTRSGAFPDPHAVLDAFFGAFNTRLKYEKGQFHTPTEVVRWATACTDHLLRKRFGARGIGDGKRIERVIDPCMGTGTFIEEVISYAAGAVDRAPEMVGFEVLPAPYALARLRVEEAARQQHGFRGETVLHLVDSLADSLVSAPTVPSRPQAASTLGAILADAAEKAKPPVMVVIGSPPSSQKPGEVAPRETIEQLLTELLPPDSMRRGGRQNVAKALRNEAYRFLRWGAERVMEKGGVMTLMMPGTLVSHPSTVGVRSWLLDRFDELLVLEVDPDIRAGQRGTLFGVQQGRCILVAVARERLGREDARATDDATRSGGATVRHASISSREIHRRREWLSRGAAGGMETQLADDFDEVTPSAPRFAFSPGVAWPDAWIDFWPLWTTEGHRGVFVGSDPDRIRFGAGTSGVKLSPTDLVFHPDQDRLVERSLAIGATKRASRRGGGTEYTSSPADVVEEWFRRAGRRRRLSADQLGDVREWFREHHNRSDLYELVRQYCYRPFVTGWVLYDEGLLERMRRVSSDGTRPRPELVAAFDRWAVGMAIAPTPRDVGNVSEGSIAAFAWVLPDNDLVRRGNARILTDVILAKRGNASVIVSNVHETLRRMTGSRDRKTASREVLFYAYAVLSSSAYFKACRAMIEQAGDPREPLRIPIPKNERLFRSVAELGRELASLENMNARMRLNARRPTRARSSSTRWLTGAASAQLAGWQHGGERLRLLDSTGSSFAEIPLGPKVGSLSMGGYAIVDSWLDLRRGEALNRDFEKRDLQALANLIGRLTRREELLKLIDGKVRKVLKSKLRPPECRADASSSAGLD